MHKDGNLRKRNGLVIPGGLLALYGFLGLVYVAFLRGDDGTCGDAGLIVFLGACRSALLVLALPIVIGLALVAVGVLAYRSKATCRAGHGSWTHFGLAFLISLVVLPLLGSVLAPSLLGPDPVITSGTVQYPIPTLLAGVSIIGLLMLIPFAFLYSAQTKANPCCREKGCFDPCFCDEPAAPAEVPLEAPPAEAAPPPAPVVIPEAPPAAPPTPAPEPTPAATPAEATPEWTAVPEEKAEWEVVPEEPAKEAATNGNRGPGRSAPPLATRPTDPAAPPADAMAVAAKWAEEDEEALQELGAPAPESGRRKQLAKGSKKKSRPVSKASPPSKPSKPKASKPAKKPRK